VETTSIRLPAFLVEAVERAASRSGVTKSTVVRRALEQYLEQTDTAPRQGLLAAVDRLVTYPGSGVGDLSVRGEDYLREMFRGRRNRSR
jgi:hypothetical protein